MLRGLQYYISARQAPSDTRVDDVGMQSTTIHALARCAFAPDSGAFRVSLLGRASLVILYSYTITGTHEIRSLKAYGIHMVMRII